MKPPPLPDLAAASFQCVHFLPVAEKEVVADASGTARVATLDGGQVRGDADLLDRLAAAFAAPSYFGGNWDALDEILRDLEWLGAPPAGGHVLLVDGAAALWVSHGPAAGRLVEAWLAAAESWAAEGVPFHLVFLW
jgi:hypothetical protein